MSDKPDEEVKRVGPAGIPVRGREPRNSVPVDAAAEKLLRDGFFKGDAARKVRRILRERQMKLTPKGP